MEFSYRFYRTRKTNFLAKSKDAEKKFAEISKFIEGKLKIKANT